MKLVKKPFIASAVSVFLIGLSVFAIFSLYPFGNLTVAWCDMKQQVLPLMIEFRNILLGKSSMFLNLQNAGGTSLWGIFLFFLASPFTFLVAFIKPSSLYLFINVIILMKMATCAVCASIFFEKVYKNLSYVQNVALSTMYAFCGYTMLYFQNIVWLDAMYLFPLLLLGIYYIFKNYKPYLFVAAFSALIVVHFYLTYMVSLFVILFAVIYSFLCFRKVRREKVLHLIAGGAFVSFLITAVCWIPMLFEYFASARGVSVIDNLKNSNFLTSYPTTLMSVLCTGIILPAVIMFFVLKKYSSRQYVSLVITLFLCAVPLIFEGANKMWHTGSYQAFPSRYAFITVFIGLVVAAKLISEINKENTLKEESNISFIIILSSVLLLILGMYLLRTKENVLNSYVYTLWMNTQGFKEFLKFTVVACVIYLLAFFFYKNLKITKRAFTTAICALVIAESVFSTSVFFGFAGNDISYNQDILILSDRVSDTDEFRVKTDSKRFDVNIVGSLSYGSLSHYTSFTNKDYHAFMKNCGYSSYWMEVSSVGATKFTDYILGNRYEIVPRDDSLDNIVAFSLNFSLVQKYGDASLAYVISENNPENIEKLTDNERILKQNAWFKAVSGFDKELITEIQPSNNGNVISDNDVIENISNLNDKYNGLIHYKVDVTGKKTLYFDCFNEISTKLREVINGSCNVFVNGYKVSEKYPTQNSNGILNLGTFENETVSIDVEILKSVNARSFGLYSFDDELFEQYVRISQTGKVVQKNNKLNISAYSEKDDNLLLISVPYNEGYKAKVNGKKAEIYRVFDNLMAVKLKEGENEVTLSFLPKGFIFGLVISSLTIVLIGVSLFFKKKNNFSVIDKTFKFSKYTAMLFYIVFIAVIILIYLLPLFLFFA